MSSTAVRTCQAAALTAALVMPLAAVPNQGATRCSLSVDKRQWIQRALSAWMRASDDLLGLPPEPLPWTILFDGECTWHLAPDPARLGVDQLMPTELRFRDQTVLVHEVPNDGFVRLPSGDSFPVQPRVYAALSSNLDRPFFVAALPSVFRTDPAAAADTLLDVRILGVISHEILHTRQLPDLGRQLANLGERFTLPAQLDDDVVERTFRDNAAFRTAFEEERDLLYAAAFEPNRDRALAQARDAVNAIRARRATNFTGQYEVYARLEDIFLNMEGVAEWVRFKLHSTGVGEWASEREIVAFIRGRNNDWVQDEGLALYLLLDRFAPNWQQHLLDTNMASPVDALAAALER